VRDHVPHVVLRVHSQIPWCEPTVRRLQSRFGLTLREAQVAAGVARGHTNAEVAERLGIVEKTVKNVLMSVFTKCKVRNRVELALRAFDAPIADLNTRRPS
jgi:DNA-binding NarL/FixJ family response regulator